MAESAGKSTRHIRVAEDLADMLGDLASVGAGSSAQFLDPYIRPVIEEAHQKNRKAIESLRAAKATNAKAAARA